MLEGIPRELRESFDAPHVQRNFGEVGSRGSQRMLVTQISYGDSTVAMMVNDWIDVQEGYYRHLAIEDQGEIVIRIVIAEYLACEVAWKS